MKQLESVQALRGIAALLVFMGHLIAIEKIHAGRPQPLTEFWASGIYGVDLFFVISGFVIVWVGADMPQNWQSSRRFITARIVRIYPSWWLFASSAAVAYWLANGVPWNIERISGVGLEHLLHSFLLWPQPTPPVLSVGWTLIHEMYFYIGFACLIFLVPVHHRFRAFIAWGIVVFAGAALGLSSGFSGNLIELIFYPMTLEFIAGGLVAFLIKAKVRRAAMTCLTLGGAAYIIGFVSVDVVPIGLNKLGLEWQRTLVFGVASSLIIYGAVVLELENKLQRGWMRRAFVALGNWSYAFYLCHVLTISVTGRIVYGWLNLTGSVGVVLFMVTATVTSLITAFATYRVFERPIISAFKHRRTSVARAAM